MRARAVGSKPQVKVAGGEPYVAKRHGDPIGERGEAGHRAVNEDGGGRGEWEWWIVVSPGAQVTLSRGCNSDEVEDRGFGRVLWNAAAHLASALSTEVRTCNQKVAGDTG